MSVEGNASTRIGLIPAAGTASRLSPLSCSKEIYPIGFDRDRGTTIVACSGLLEGLREADVETAFCVLREGKWDIPAYLRDGTPFGIRLAYLINRVPYGVPYTLRQAFPFLRGATVCVGFPDILFQPRNAFRRLLERQEDTDAALVLGLFPASDPHTADMVDRDDGGRVRAVHVKPADSPLRYAWVLAVWMPPMTTFIDAYLSRAGEGRGGRPARKDAIRREDELYLGTVFQRAIDAGLHVEAVTFEDGWYVDIGTPGGLGRAFSGEFQSSLT